MIAAVVPVPDEATAGLMLELDGSSPAGSPAHALIHARAATETNRAGAAFVCFGAG